MSRLLLGVLLLMVFSASSLTAQRNCGSMDHLHERLEQNPNLQQNLDRIEQFTKDYQREYGSKELNGGILTIPVVVHVVYRTNAENVSDAQIQSQIDVLNEDFRRMNPDASNTPSDFVGVAADSEIEFCLTGVTRTATSVSSHGTNDSVKFNSSGGKDAENPTTSLNMWVCNIGGGILGYAQFPGDAAATDGVVVDYRYFGTIGTATAPFDLGRTTTHEVGHWLNLRHIWGDGGCNVDDFVSDTPSASGPNYTGSPCSYPGPNSCRPKGRKGGDDLPDMFQNYMDYSDDGCMNLFTVGQADRMWAAINASRPGLLSAACDGTPPPPPPAQEICDNGIDDDGDGDVDCDDSDCSNASNCDTTPPPSGCDAPTGLSHSRAKGGREANLSWNAVGGAASYDVEVYNSSGALHASGTITSNGANVGGLTKNASYTWRVRANCGSNGLSDWSNGSFNARVALQTFEEVSISPNPASNQTWLTWDLESETPIGIFELKDKLQNQNEFTVEVISATGQILNSINTTDNAMSLDLSNVDAGIYVVRIQDSQGNNAIKKLVVK